MILETQRTIGRWAIGVFGRDIREYARKVKEEASEVHDDIDAEQAFHEYGRSLNGPPPATMRSLAAVRRKIAEECADILIVLFTICYCLGVDLLAEVQRKMAVNRGRTWYYDLDTQTYNHVRGNEREPL